jgi:hypothetical protein
MRTTVTLDPDVAAKLRQMTRERGISFKEAINSSVRLGLERGAPSSRPYTVKARRLGAKRGLDLDRASHLAAQFEDAETLRKLELRK